MGKEDQQRLPFGAVEIEAKARHTSIMTLISLLDKRDLHLRELMLAIYRLEKPAQGLVMTYEQLASPRELCCDRSKARRTVDLAKSLGIITGEPAKRQDGRTGANEYRINWLAVHDVIASKTGGHRRSKRSSIQPAQYEQGPDHIEQGPDHIEQGPDHIEQARIYRSRTHAFSSPSLPLSFDVDDGGDDRGDEKQARAESLRDDGEGLATASADTGPGGTANAGLVLIRTDRRRLTQREQLVAIVAQCHVDKAEAAVDMALRHGQDAQQILAVIEAWRDRRECWDEVEAPRKLYWRLHDRPKGLAPAEGWALRYPTRIKARERRQAKSSEDEAERQRVERVRREQLAAQAAGERFRALSINEQDRLFAKYLSQAKKSEVDFANGSKSRDPSDNGFFKLWLSKQGGANDNAS